jgi:hypothetical protein
VSALDWTLVQNALRGWIVAATGLDTDHVIWAYPDNPSPLRPFAWVEILSGPTSQASAERRRASQIMQERYLVLEAEEQDYTITVMADAPDDDSGTPYTYEADGDDTFASIRDGLVALLADEPDLVITPDGTNALIIAGTEDRPRFHSVAADPSRLDKTIPADAIRETTYQPAEITVQLTIETASQLPASHARAYLTDAAMALGDGVVLEALRAGHVHYRRTLSPVDLSQVVNDRHVSRMAQDFVFGVGLQASRDVPWARTATATGTVGG